MRVHTLLGWWIGMICLFVQAAGAHSFSDLQADPIGLENLSGKPIKVIVIHVATEPQMQIHWQKTAADLMNLEAGDLYAPEQLLQAAKLLDASGLFREIRVEDPRQTGDGVEIRLFLTPFDRVEKITVDGAFPLYEKEILNVMTLYSGMPFDPDRLNEQADRVRQFLKKEGFVAPEVEIQVKQNRRSHRYALKVKIRKKRFLRIEEIQFKGNHTFPTPMLRLRTKSATYFSLPFMGRRFVERNLQKDEAALLAFYREKGFADAKVAVVAEKHPETGVVKLLFDIQEGAEKIISYEGNDAISSTALNSHLKKETEKSQGRFSLRRTLRVLKNHYLEKGYRDVAITHQMREILERGKTVQELRFVIAEGSRYVIELFNIFGNTGVSSQKIRQQVLSSPGGLTGENGYAKKKLEADLAAIRTLYLKEGYGEIRLEKEVEVQDEENSGLAEKKVRIRIRVTEGPRTMVGSLRYIGTPPSDAAGFLNRLSLQPATPFREYMIASDENLIKAYYSGKGHPHVTVRGEATLNPEKTRAEILFTVNPGPFVQVGQIIYTGNFRTRETLLDESSAKLTQSPFSLKHLLEARRDLMNLTSLDGVRVRTPGLKEKLPEVDLVFEVEEKRPYLVELGAGYDTQRSVYAEFSAGDQNFTGRDLQLRTQWEISRIGYGAELSLVNPHLLSTKTVSTTRLFIEEAEEFNRKYGNRSYGLSQEFHRTILDDQVTLKFGSTFKSNEQYRRQAPDQGEEDERQFGTRRIFTLTPSILYRTTDSYVSPSKGFLVTAQTDLSKGVDNRLDDFIKYQADVRWYRPLFDSLTLAIRARYGIVVPYGGEGAVPEDQLFFLGGTATVRGFDENMLLSDGDGNAVGGREQLLGSMELRWQMGKGWELALFSDAGMLRQSESVAAEDDIRTSVGLGIRYMTPIGPVGLMYGHKLSPLEGESSGAFHFSMGYTF